MWRRQACNSVVGKGEALDAVRAVYKWSAYRRNLCAESMHPWRHRERRLTANRAEARVWAYRQSLTRRNEGTTG